STSPHNEPTRKGTTCPISKTDEFFRNRRHTTKSADPGLYSQRITALPRRLRMVKSGLSIVNDGAPRLHGIPATQYRGTTRNRLMTHREASDHRLGSTDHLSRAREKPWASRSTSSFDYQGTFREMTSCLASLVCARPLQRNISTKYHRSSRRAIRTPS